MRLYPHDQNTGGFFVCVLERSGKPLESIGTTDPVPAPPPAERAPAVEAEVVASVDESGTSSLKRAAPPSPSPNEPVAETESKKPKQERAAEAESEVKPEQKEKSQPQPQPQPKGKKTRRDIGFKEDPFSYVDPDHVEVNSLM